MLNQAGNKIIIALIVPTLTYGGLERVMTELATQFSENNNADIHLISLTNGNIFYTLPKEVMIHMPNFDHKKYSRVVFTIKILKFLRKKLKEIKPGSLLSFGGKYNSFVILASEKLQIKRYISDRSKPTISYGKLLDWLNPILYRRTDGIIAQTQQAKRVMFSKTKHANIAVIGNPIVQYKSSSSANEKIILNVGRFIASKNQMLLIEYFAEINQPDWKLIFLGDGKLFEKVKHKATSLGLINVVFEGVKTDILSYYNKASIFAFTSTSEGFPNVLGEAMSAGLACISYNCEAGPADLIEDGVSGFLINEFDHETYIEKLKLLMDDRNLREKIGTTAQTSISQYSRELISDQYFSFITNNATAN